jgi:hypothetical protein
MGSVTVRAVAEDTSDSVTSKVQGIARRQQAIAFVLLVAVLGLSRYVLLPRYLITFDQINFALAVREFNPGLSQPQLPGYPLFVGLLKLLSVALPTIESVFLAAGWILSAVALGFIWKAGDAIGGTRCGLIAASLLLFNPAFWYSALTNPVRLCFATGATGIALCAWYAGAQRSKGWFVLAAGGLGFCAGFRPELPILLGPVIGWAAWRVKPNRQVGVAAALLFSAGIVTWAPSLIQAMGGWPSFVEALSRYSQAQIAPTSPLLGAPFADAVQMAWKALVWSCLGALSWLWAVPILVRQKRAATVFPPAAAGFLLLWFLPGLIFYATFHVGDPDHTLAIVPATCVAGAMVLSVLSANQSLRRRSAIVMVAVLLNIFLFVKPISKTAKASTYWPVRWLDNYISAVVDGTNSLSSERVSTVVFHAAVTGWRQLSYYNPGVPIIAVDAAANSTTRVLHIQGNHMTETIVDGTSIDIPACGAVLWVDPALPPTKADGTPLRATHLRVFAAHPSRGDTFDFHGFRFVATRHGCND